MVQRRWRSSVVETLDRYDVPDGLPFIVDDDGSLTGCDRLNTYLLTAQRQRAYAPWTYLGSFTGQMVTPKYSGGSRPMTVFSARQRAVLVVPVRR